MFTYVYTTFVDLWGEGCEKIKAPEIEISAPENAIERVEHVPASLQWQRLWQ